MTRVVATGAAMLALAGCASAPLSATIRTSSGALAGGNPDGAGVRSFKGIPYAAAPVGALRWRGPQAATPWAGTRDATQFGPRCWSAAPFGGPIPTENVSEDCLFLNVWTGAASSSEKRPVMVFVHGGGFQFGSGSDPVLDGAALARKGVITVTFNYRLGVFGFLGRQDLDRESNGQGSGMYGVLDQIAALQWVKANIAAFGGDPNNVTLFGESAGAHAVGILMASPLATGLFHKAIGQSGAFWESENGPMKSKAEAHARGTALGEKLGADTLDRLRAMPAAQLQAATPWTFATDPSVTNFSPIVDGHVLPQRPDRQFVEGRQNDVPLLVGWTADEGGLFFNRALPHKTTEAFTGAAAQAFGQAAMPRFLTLYPATSPSEAAKSAQTLIGDQVIAFQTWKWAHLQRKTGRSPVYVYRFEQTSPYTPAPLHIADVPYVFGNLAPKKGVAPGSQDIALSDAMQTYWSRFARTGNPNGDDLPAWPGYGGPGGQVMRLGPVMQAGTEDGTARFEFLERMEQVAR